MTNTRQTNIARSYKFVPLRIIDGDREFRPVSVESKRFKSESELKKECGKSNNELRN